MGFDVDLDKGFLVYYKLSSSGVFFYIKNLYTMKAIKRIWKTLDGYEQEYYDLVYILNVNNT